MKKIKLYLILADISISINGDEYSEYVEDIYLGHVWSDNIDDVKAKGEELLDRYCSSNYSIVLSESNYHIKEIKL